MSITPVSPTAPASRKRALACQIAAWMLAVVAACLAILAWGHDHAWHILPLNAYTLFPVLGLLAFSLMWSHYMAAFIRQMFKLESPVLRNYFESTSFIVLALICLHPGLLIYQRFRDGFGLPPHSYESYVAPGLGWVTVLGSASLLVFLAYEFRRKYGSRSWWHYMQLATDAAMLAIFYHALRLGDEVQRGWYHGVWLFYGISLVLVLIYNYRKKYFGEPSL